MKKVIMLLVMTGALNMVQAQTKAIEVTKSGEGVPVLFLPGFSCPGSVWNKTVAQLPAGFQPHQVTYAGFGGVTAIPLPWYASLKKELIAYIETNNLQNICVIGHSMGGTLATDLAEALPNRITKILLVDAIPCMREIMMPGVSAAQITYDSPYSTQMLNMDDAAMKQYAKIMAGSMASNQPDIDSIVHFAVQADRKTYVNGYIDLLKLDLRNALTNIKADVLIMGAPFPSKEAVAGNYEKQYANLKNKQIIYAPAGKHFIMFDQPEWFYNQTNTFLQK